MVCSCHRSFSDLVWYMTDQIQFRGHILLYISNGEAINKHLFWINDRPNSNGYLEHWKTITLTPILLNVYVCMRLCAYIHAHVYMCVCTQAHVCMSVCMHMCVRVCLCVCLRVYACLHTHVCICVHMHILRHKVIFNFLYIIKGRIPPPLNASEE